MSPQEVVNTANTKFQAAVSRFEAEVKKLRTGRAHPAMLDGVVAEAYGQPMPLIQLATISAPEAQLLQVTPFDPNNLKAIAAAIRDNQSLGMNPTDDGRLIRIPIPPHSWATTSPMKRITPTINRNTDMYGLFYHARQPFD